jgi:hypothetical protein
VQSTFSVRVARQSIQHEHVDTNSGTVAVHEVPTLHLITQIAADNADRASTKTQLRCNLPGKSRTCRTLSMVQLLASVLV